MPMLSYEKLCSLQERFRKARDESAVYAVATQIQGQEGRMAMFSALAALHLDGKMTKEQEAVFVKLAQRMSKRHRKDIKIMEPSECDDCLPPTYCSLQEVYLDILRSRIK